MRNVLCGRLSLGDTVSMTPIVEGIKRKYPDEKLVVVCRPEYEEVFHHNPFVDHIGGKPERGDRLFNLIWQTKPDDYKHHIIEWYMRQVGLDELDNILPTMYGIEKEMVDPSLPANDTLKIAVDISSGWRSRTWPKENFEAVVSKLHEELGVTVIEVGKRFPENGQTGNTRHLKGAHLSYRNTLSIRQTASVIAQCDYFLGNDSGLSHVAAAVRTKAFVIFGPVAHETRAHGDLTIPFHGTTCYGCVSKGERKFSDILNGCDKGLLCLKEVTSDSVFNTMRTFINKQS